MAYRPGRRTIISVGRATQPSAAATSHVNREAGLYGEDTEASSVTDACRSAASAAAGARLTSWIHAATRSAAARSTGLVPVSISAISAAADPIWAATSSG